MLSGENASCFGPTPVITLPCIAARTALPVRATVANTFDVDDDEASGDSVRIATGVEMTRQLVELRALDCDAAQGDFFARPREAEAIEPLLGRRFVG